MEYARQSRLVLYEDRKPLLQRHAQLDDIKRIGCGTYCHWNGELFFSASDNSDPNVNGRRYSFRLEPETPWVLSYGSCHLNDAILHGLAVREMVRPVVTIPSYTLSVPEALQQIAFFRNEFRPTQDEIEFCMSYSDYQVARRDRMHAADVVFLEICCPFPVCFRSMVLNRAQMVDLIVRPLQQLSLECDKRAVEWYFKGIIQQDEVARVEGGSFLLEAMPRDFPRYDMIQSIIREARINTQNRVELKKSVLDFCKCFPGSVIITLSHNLRYMPDGRPISWPGPFYREVNDVCAELGLPIFNTRELVAMQGVEFSLTSDLSHYTPAFYTLMGDHLLQMIGKELPEFSVAS